MGAAVRRAAAVALALTLMAVIATAQDPLAAAQLPEPAAPLPAAAVPAAAVDAEPVAPVAQPAVPQPAPVKQPAAAAAAAPPPAPAAADDPLAPLFETAEGVPNRPVGPPAEDVAIADEEILLEDGGPRCAVEPGMYGCTLQGRLLPNTTVAYTLTLPEAAAGQGYRLMTTLRTVNGMAEMTIASVARGTPAAFDTPSLEAYATPVATELFAVVPAAQTRQSAGEDVFIGLGMASRPLMYSLRVSMPLSSVVLDAKEMQAVRDLNAKCCGAPALERAKAGTAGVGSGDAETADGTRTRTMCAKEIPAAAADDHAPEDDICNQPPNVCDADGRLLTLSLPRAGLYCRGGLPESLGKLGRLEVLDLAFNDLDGQDISDVAEVRGEERR